MRSRTAAVLGIIVAALLAWLLLRKGPPPSSPAVPVPPPRAAPADSIASATPRPAPAPAEASTKTPDAAPSPAPADGLVPLRGEAVHVPKGGVEVPAAGARFFLVEGGPEMDADAGTYRGQRSIVADAEGRFEVRVHPGIDVHLFEDAADVRWAFPRGMARQVPAPGIDFASGAWRVHVVPRGRVAGTVYDPEGNPVADATVVAASMGDDSRMPQWVVPSSPRTATTDRRGCFSLDGLRPNEDFAVVAWKPPWAKTLSEPFDMEAGKAVEGVVVRLARGAPLSGVVTDSASGPVGGARVRLTRGSSVRLQERTRPALHPEPQSTDARGAYRFEGLETGIWRVFADAPGFLPADVPDVQVGPEGAEAPTLVLRKGAPFRGRVVDEEGAAVEGAVISLHAEGGGGGSTASGLDGRFELLAGPGAAKLFAGRFGFAKWEPRTVAVPQEAEFVVVLARGFALEGSIQDVDGTPVPEASVFVNGFPFGGRSDAMVSADKEGKFRVPGLGPEACVLRVHAEGHVFPEFRDVRPPATGLVLRAVKGATIAGVVVDAAGAPVAGAHVAVGRRSDDPRGGPTGIRDALASRSQKTGEDGAFRFEGLLGDRFDLQASCDDGRAGRLSDVRADAVDLRIAVAAPR